MNESRFIIREDLTATVVRGNGQSSQRSLSSRILDRPIDWWRALYARLRRQLPFVAAMTFAAFMAWAQGDPLIFGLVTTAGVTYEATTFVNNANPLVNMRWHDCGTGTTAAAVGDTGLQSAAGTARVSGSQTNPTAIQYQTAATIPYTSTLAITEWGLFSLASGGTMWSRRVFSALNVNNGDAIQFVYTMTCTAGGGS